MTPEQIHNEVEAVCALTDLAMGLSIIPMIFALCRKKTEKENKKLWIAFFISLCSASILGFVAHYCFPTGIANDIVWAVLYPNLFEAVNLFVLLGISLRHNSEKPSKKNIMLVHIISFAGYLVCCVLVFGFHADSIICLTVFNSVYAMFGFCLIISQALKKGHIGERIILSSLTALLAGSVFQLFRNMQFHFIWYMNQNAITHILQIIGIAILFCGVMRCLSDNKIKS